MLLNPNIDKASFYSFIDKIENNMTNEDQAEIKAIISDISKYDVYDFIARIASLNLLVENQNKSILFDALIAGLLAQKRTAYCGTAKMSSGKFKSIISRLDKLRLHIKIDPAENTFIERVRYYGNYWIFPGINYSPGYSLQGFLDVLCLRNIPFNNEFLKKAHTLINFILDISNSIAQVMGYNIDSIEHVEQHTIKVPDASLMRKLQGCVCLENNLLESLIPDLSLRQCLFTEFDEAAIDQVINGEWQDFFSHPFLKTNSGDVIILNPSILVSFLIHQLIVFSGYYNVKDLLINAYNNEMWKNCRQDLRDLGHKKIQESAYGITLINNEYRKEEILSVSNNKLLIVHFICDAGIEYGEHSMFGHCKPECKFPTTRERTEYFIKNLPAANWENIFQIVILNSFGRMIGTNITVCEAQYSINLTPFELHCISINEKNHEDFIPRYIQAKKELLAAPTLVPISELNQIELYTSNDYSFYFSDDINPQKMYIQFGLGDSLDYVIKAIKKEDRHLIESHDSKHLCDIFLFDPKRKIYCTKANSLEWIVKYEKTNIWITTDEITTSEEASVYYTITDCISYWVAEARSIISNMNFLFDTINLHISLLPPVNLYYNKSSHNSAFEDFIQYEFSGNTIKMLWHPYAYQILGEKSTLPEKAMIKSIFSQIDKLNKNPVNTGEVNNLFSNPLKQKIFTTNVTATPYLTPIDGYVQTVSAEEENRLLDEIGAYFLASPEYDYGKVPNEKRNELANQVVEYLYTRLQSEIALIRPDGVYEQVCLDLEKAIYHAMLLQARFSYDIACYPEKELEIIAEYNKINQSSVSLKFFAEYIAASPPCGTIPLGAMQYDRILAICSLIIDWAYKNDLFRYNISNSPIEFLKSGRIGMSREEIDYLSKINTSARIKYLESNSNPDISTYFPANLVDDFLAEIDSAFSDEYGFSFQQFNSCIEAVADFGKTIKSDVKRAERVVLTKTVVKQTNIDPILVEKIIDQITLRQREDFLVAPKPYEKYDVYPWRFNRELSFTRRPIIQYKNDLIWGNRQLYHMQKFTTNLILNGKYKARQPKLKKLIGKLSNRRGNDFNSEVAKKLSLIDGLIVREKVSKINGKKITDTNNNELGDIDVLCIIPEKKKIIVGEVKDFAFAKNPYEMDLEYKKLFVDGRFPCYMTKHKRRSAWVREHLEDIRAHFDLLDGNWSVVTAMFVNQAIISNAFYHQKENIIVYSDITDSTIAAL